MPREAAGGRQEHPQASRRETNPAREASAWASAFSPWLPARPDGNYTRHVPAIARTMSAWRYSAISARDGSRSATANSMRHRPQRSRYTRQPDPGSSKRHRAVPQLVRTASPRSRDLRILSGVTGGLGRAVTSRLLRWPKSHIAAFLCELAAGSVALALRRPERRPTQPLERRQLCFFRRYRAWGTDGSNPSCCSGESVSPVPAIASV